MAKRGLKGAVNPLTGNMVIQKNGKFFELEMTEETQVQDTPIFWDTFTEPDGTYIATRPMDSGHTWIDNYWTNTAIIYSNEAFNDNEILTELRVFPSLQTSPLTLASSYVKHDVTVVGSPGTLLRPKLAIDINNTNWPWTPVLFYYKPGVGIYGPGGLVATDAEAFTTANYRLDAILNGENIHLDAKKDGTIVCSYDYNSAGAAWSNVYYFSINVCPNWFADGFAIDNFEAGILGGA